MFYINAIARFQADPVRSVQSLTAFIKAKYGHTLSSDIFESRWNRLVDDHRKRISAIALQARPSSGSRILPAYLMDQLRKACPAETVWVVEAVTNSVIASDQIQATIPGSWINCGGGGLGWSGGGALGVKLATTL
jgi:thiamine pyrophosphate-dependent acetolactate synthase large subunit-like protein